MALQFTSNAIYFVYDNSGGGEGGGHEQLYRFERNGEKPIMIGNVGRGPHEYSSSTFFVVDEENDRIYINGRINTVLVFNTKGKFIRDFEFQDPDIRFGQLQLLGNKYLLVPQQRRGARAEYLWSIIDTLGNVITSKRNYTPAFETGTGAQSGAYSFNGNISCWVDYNDTIFTISPDFNFKPSFIMVPGEHRKPKEEIPFTLDLLDRLAEYYSPHDFMESKTYLISQYSYKGNAYLFLNKNNLKTSVCYFEWKKDEKGGIPNNFDGGSMFSPDTYFEENGNEYLAGIIQPIELKNHVASAAFKNSTPKYPEKKKQLEQLANSLDENDNPVLMIVKLK